MGSVMIFVSILLFISLLFASLTFVITIRPQPITGALPLAFVLLIALESVILNVLSLTSQVTVTGILVAHLLVLLIWIMWVLRREGQIPKYVLQRIFNLGSKFLTSPCFWILAPSLLLMVFLATIYPPNTYDSMTYHMARVAHWIQLQSIDYYPTNISRQNQMGPGAEYLILFFQILTNTDYLANFIQFISFLLSISALSYLLRIYLMPRKIAFPALLLGVTAPMVFMQSVTTQNDLVCGITALAIVMVISRLFLGNVNKITKADYFLLGVCLAAAYLVKPIALIVTAPFLIFGLFLQISRLFSFRHIRATVIGIVIVLCTLSIIAGPDMGRKIQHGLQRPEVYPLFSGWNFERIVNPIKITGQNSPWPSFNEKLLRRIGSYNYRLEKSVFETNRDLIGNPIQLMVFILFSVLTLSFIPAVLRNHRKYIHLFLFSVSPLAAWILFGIIVKNQIWITRLQVPLVLIIPFSILLFSRLTRHYRPVQLGLLGLLNVLAVFSVMYSTFSLANYHSRELDLQSFWQPADKRPAGYYEEMPGLHELHIKVLKSAESYSCSRVGLMTWGDTWDYPLTWQLMAEKKNTKHVFTHKSDNSEWPCLLYFKTGPGQAFNTPGWLSTDSPHVYLRDLEYEFEQAAHTCYSAHAHNLLESIDLLSANQIVREAGAFRPTGEDPYLLLPPFSCGSARSAVLKLDVYSSVESYIQVFFPSKGVNRYTSQRSTSRKRLNKGENEVFFFLPADELVGALRLDFGDVNGVIKINSIAAKTIDER